MDKRVTQIKNPMSSVCMLTFKINLKDYHLFHAIIVLNKLKLGAFRNQRIRILPRPLLLLYHLTTSQLLASTLAYTTITYVTNKIFHPYSVTKTETPHKKQFMGIDNLLTMKVDYNMNTSNMKSNIRE